MGGVRSSRSVLGPRYLRDPLRAHPNSDAALGQLVQIIRWATFSAIAALATPALLDTDRATAVALTILFAYTVFRSFRPIVGPMAPVACILEAGSICLALVATGLFNSPFVLGLVAPIVVAAFSSGMNTSLRLALACTVAIGLPTLVNSDLDRADHRTVTQGGMLLVLVALVASYAYRVLSDDRERADRAERRLDRMEDANHLLSVLHEISQDLPSSLDLDEVLDSTLESIHGLVPMTFAAVLLETEAGTGWQIVGRDGPAPDDTAAMSIADLRTTLTTCAVSPYQRGSATVFPGMNDARCVALRARDTTIGALVVEHATPSIYGKPHEEALLLLAETAALSIDNARMFARLRTLAAHQERARIARELHDRMGQSLAYLGFELDRIGPSASQPAGEELATLRNFVRGMTGEMRDTLADLRTEISEVAEAGSVLHEFGSRVEARSGMTVRVDIDPDLNLAPLRVRELWRITQEAVLNAERHSSATRVSVTWHSHDGEVVAEVRDNGTGLPISAPDPSAGHYGLVGMRERAASIGASISIDSLRASSGTRVQVNVPINRPEPSVMAIR